ncbi:MAG: hypothetical protein K8R36_19435 [Planctomycetales bacterium]|nr:hypothetical protein [Planctomycetales bacterium]
MFAWIQQLLGINSASTPEEHRTHLRRRMQRETEEILKHELELSSSGLRRLSRAQSAALRRRASTDGGGQA